jgi:putative nucleotidyltransferase with HDIG domain
LIKTNAPPRLVAHLILVHDLAVQLIEQIGLAFPALRFNREAILFGAATHDLGKTLDREELSKSGRVHETRGVELLKSLGVSEARARFAFTHNNWRSADPLQIEDILVALADKTWKGKRIDDLDAAAVEMISRQSRIEPWQCFSVLDEILQSLAAKADERLAWQGSFSVNPEHS